MKGTLEQAGSRWRLRLPGTWTTPCRGCGGR